MRFYLIILLTILCVSCDLNASKEAVDQEQSTTKSAPISEKEIEALDYLDYGLSTASKKAVQHWKSYSELETILETIKKGDLSYFNGDKEVIKTFFFELESTIPERVISQAIVLRLTALKTKFYKLQSAATLSTTSRNELLSTMKEFFVSCSNLNLQINKKLEKDAQDISKTNL